MPFLLSDRCRRILELKLYFGFVDLEKAFDRLLRGVIRWAMRKFGVAEWLVLAVMSVYTGVKTVVRTVYGNINGFEVKVGMHQGSALSPELFVIVMEGLSREFRVALSWELLYADDFVVVAETENDLIKRLKERKDFVENRGMRVTHMRAHTHTHTFYTSLDFVWDNPGEPVPEETFTHLHLLWSSVVPYLLCASNMIHGILPVQSTCLTVFFHNFCSSFL